MTDTTKSKAQRKRELRELLAEGMHAAFRKASGHPSAHQIWMLIRDIPDREWASIADFVASGIDHLCEEPKKERQRHV